ncbi:MAG: response regulator, partial [Clostridiales bacterium]|nr:response regulator [Clostridiales bacterium]
SNAIKFTSNNGTVHLGATLTNEKDGFCDICIDVSDSGIGISPEHQKRLFQAFEQAESGITREYGGTGLGLVISKHIIELMGGKISLVSESGKGSRFSFNFKAARSNRSSRSMLLPGVNWDTVRVMVVDDIADTRDQVQGILTQIGIMCDAAADGFEALRLTEDFGVYDIYFIDWYMPGMNGILLTRKIKALATNKNSIVVMITAMDWEQFREEALEAGVCKCLLKPLLSSTIIDCVNNCLGISEEVRDTNIREFSGKTLLLAEDIEINREILSALLEETGITIDCAANGEDALTLISENPNKYDIVFMDLQMPKMDGLEATRRIRALPARPRGRLPIVAMTANVFKSDIEKCIDAGMDDHLGKPLDIDKVLEKLRAYLV